MEEKEKGYDGGLDRVKDEKGKIIYYKSKYWRPSVAADSVVFGYDEKMGRLCLLLILRGEEPFGWALPGGFMQEGDDSIEHRAKLELEEETKLNLKLSLLEQLGVFSKKGRDPRDRIISVAFMAMVRMSDYSPEGGSDARKASWFPVSEILSDNPPVSLVFDHKEIIMKALKKLQRDIRFRPIGFDLLNESFTMPQLCRLYLSILFPDFEYDEDKDISAEGKVKLDNKNLPIERSNFSKKMLSLGILKKDEEKNKEERKTKLAYRHPIWYKFDKEEYDKKKEEGFYVVFNQKKRDPDSKKKADSKMKKDSSKEVGDVLSKKKSADASNKE